MTTAAIRGGLLTLAEPAKPNAPAGTCTWCGEAIKLRAGAGHLRARRTCHRGDTWELGDRDCRTEFNRSRCWSARDLIILRGDLECADCGTTEGAWEADHEIPLWNGGEHVAENIVRRCGRCHKTKTATEAGERARARRQARR